MKLKADYVFGSIAIAVLTLLFYFLLSNTTNSINGRLDDMNDRITETNSTLNNTINRVGDGVKENGTAIQELSHHVTALEAKLEIIIPLIRSASDPASDKNMVEKGRSSDTEPSHEEPMPFSA